MSVGEDLCADPLNEHQMAKKKEERRCWHTLARLVISPELGSVVFSVTSRGRKPAGSGEKLNDIQGLKALSTSNDGPEFFALVALPPVSHIRWPRTQPSIIAGG